MKAEDIKFVPWHGGECPVPAGHDVSLKFRVGITSRDCNPEKYFWGNNGDNTNIVGYFDHTEAERLTELFALSPADATHFWLDDYYIYQKTGALEVWKKDYSNWIISSYCRSDLRDAIQDGSAIEIPPRERELNLVADELCEMLDGVIDGFLERYDRGGIGWHDGDFIFSMDECRAREQQRIAAGLIDVKATDESYVTWTDVPDDLKWLAENVKECPCAYIKKAIGGHEAADMRNQFNSLGRYFTKAQWQRAREIYEAKEYCSDWDAADAEQAKQDSQQEWANGEFKKELKILLDKYGVAIVCRDSKKDSNLGIEIGFQKGIESEWTGRHHVTGYDLKPDERDAMISDMAKVMFEAGANIGEPGAINDTTLGDLYDWLVSTGRLTQGGGDEC